jgi:hypothetical protein
MSRDKVAATHVREYLQSPVRQCAPVAVLREGARRVSKRHADADRSQMSARSTSSSRLGPSTAPRARRLTSFLCSVVICSHLSTDASERPPSPRRRRTCVGASERRVEHGITMTSESQIVSDVGRYDQDRPKLIEVGNVQLATPQAAGARRSRQRGPRRPRIAGASAYVRRRATLERARESASSSARSSPRRQPSLPRFPSQRTSWRRAARVRLAFSLFARCEPWKLTQKHVALTAPG